MLVRSVVQDRDGFEEIMGATAVRAVALREHRSERMIRMLLPLAFRDPKLVRAALRGSLPRGVSTRRRLDAPLGWHEQ